MLKITIISVVYNAKIDLLDTINNVLSLPEKVDFIIIDGGSDDGTVDVIKSNERSLKYWCSEPDSGIYDAMNKGWAAADLDSSILFLGAGDKILSLPVISSDEVIFGDVKIGDKMLFSSRVNWRTKLHNTIHHQALLVPKKLHPDPPFNTNYKVYSDFDFNQRLLLADQNFRYAKDFVGYAKPDGISADFHLKENFHIVYKNHGLVWSLCSLLFCTLSIIKNHSVGFLNRLARNNES